MPRLSMLPTLFRESMVARNLPREIEPDLIMDNGDQVEAYAYAGRIDGVMSAAYLFHTARITQLIQGSKFIVDLGCGPATQLAQIADLNPETEFLGIDLSETMLANAEKHVAKLGLNNVRFLQGDLTNLSQIHNASVDAVISTMALHHLPTLELLEQSFREIKRIIKPSGLVYLVDFGRLKSLKSVMFFAYLNREHQPHIFSLDYERSLRAAFLPEDFIKLTQDILGAEYQVFTTFGIPILTLIKSKREQPIPSFIREHLQKMRKALPPKYRSELDDIRMLFWLGGLRDDPFS